MNSDYIYRLLYQNAMKICDDCTAEGWRCCAKDACDVTLEQSPDMERLYDKNKEIPFMGKHGCLVPPEKRHSCTLFICNRIMDDHSVNRTHMKLIAKLPPAERRHAKAYMQHIRGLYKKT